VAVVYSETWGWHVFGLATALTIAVGWLPAESRLPFARRLLLRALLCAVIAGAVVGHALTIFLKADGQAIETSEDEPVFDYMAPPPTSRATPASSTSSPPLPGR